jgi:tRNA(fMet)-specific endonuclease VapC
LTRYLLDTNIISDLVKQPQGKVAKKIAEVGDTAILTSMIVAAELRFGCAKLGSARLTDRVELLLAEIPILDFDRAASLVYAELRASLDKKGTLIGANDLLIASQALSAGAVMVTANTDEFARIEQLTIENWLG